jgi:hypothetical protein
MPAFVEKMHLLGTFKMRTRAILPLLFVAFIVLTRPADSQTTDSVDQREAELFRKMTLGETKDPEKTGGLVIGEYVLSDSALQLFRKSPKLADAVRRIETVAWKEEPFDKQNAELTIRQRMDDYLDTAIAFYDGQGKRNARHENLTDIELGDRQLSNALQSVRMAHAWDVPLDPEHVKKLKLAIQKRYAIGPSPPK